LIVFSNNQIHGKSKLKTTYGTFPLIIGLRQIYYHIILSATASSVVKQKVNNKKAGWLDH